MPGSTTNTRFYSPGSYRLDDSVGYLMRRVVASIVRQAETHLEPHGVTHAQWQPLFRLSTEGKPMAILELARELQIDAAAMTRLLDRIEKKGLCKRVRSTEDRRVVMVELTAKGRAVAAVLPTVLSDALNMHLAGFSKAEWQTLIDYLQRMLKNGSAASHQYVAASPSRSLFLPK